MIVGADGSGFFDLQTGESVYLIYDPDTNQFYNELTGESAELIGDAINAARDTLIGIFGRQGYPQTGRNNQVYQQTSIRQQPQSSTSPGSFNTQGVSVKWYTVAGIAALVGAIVFGGKIKW